MWIAVSAANGRKAVPPLLPSERRRTKPWPKSISGHQRALAGREVAAGEDGVVAADPAAERDLHDGQRDDDDQADAQPRRNDQPARRVALGLDREQREQAHAAEQMQA